MLLGLSISELILPTILLLNITLFTFKTEIEKLLSHSTLQHNAISVAIITLPSILLFGYLITSVGIIITLYALILIIIAGYIFLIGFCANRKYIYGLAIILLLTSFLLNTIGFIEIASYTIVLFYLTIVLGIIKDLLYERIFEN